MKNQTGKSRNRCKYGFTFWDLLAGLAIIVIAAAICIWVVMAAREEGSMSTCLDNERRIGKALLQYSADYDQTLPAEDTSGRRPGDSWISQSFAYLKTPTILHCPDDGTPEVNTGTERLYPDSYALNSNLAGWVLPGRHPSTTDTILSPAHTVMIFEVGYSLAAIVPAPYPTISGAATGNGGDDCGATVGAESRTFPCGRSFDTLGRSVPVYATGDLGRRVLNGAEGSVGRHQGGANYVACDGHVVHLQPPFVSGGKTSVTSYCQQGTVPNQPSRCRDQLRVNAAGTGDPCYSLTFSPR